MAINDEPEYIDEYVNEIITGQLQEAKDHLSKALEWVNRSEEGGTTHYKEIYRALEDTEGTLGFISTDVTVWKYWRNLFIASSYRQNPYEENAFLVSIRLLSECITMLEEFLTLEPPPLGLD